MFWNPRPHYGRKGIPRAKKHEFFLVFGKQSRRLSHSFSVKSNLVHSVAWGVGLGAMGDRAAVLWSSKSNQA